MPDIKTFYLPDLGEGLPDATIVEWHVQQGDSVKLDAPLVSMETAKAVVDVPAPYTGTITRLCGLAGDVITTGAALAEFELDPHGKQRADAAATGHDHGAKPSVGHAASPQEDSPTFSAQKNPPSAETVREDEGTVVGAMTTDHRLYIEPISSTGGVKAVPAVRALAKKLKVDLSRITPSGSDGVITLRDVKYAAANGHMLKQDAPHAQCPEGLSATARSASPQTGERSPISLAGRPVRTASPAAQASGQPEQLKGVRRNMARVMAEAHRSVVPTTLVDDADLHAWVGKQDLTVRLIRAIIAACKAVPALNAWFDGENLSRTLHPHVDIGIAVDTEDGLFVPVLRNANMLDAAGMRMAIQRLRNQVENRSIPAAELTGHTISLSNFGMLAGRYATPVVVPPAVAIIGAGQLSHDVIAVMGGIEVHRRIPLSLTFDHRAVTGGEAARFLKALLEDLALPH